MAANWIITISTSEEGKADKVYRVSGNADQVKEHLFDIIKSDKHDRREGCVWEYGSDELSEIEERSDGTLYGYGCFYKCPNNFEKKYTATPEMSVKML